MQVLFILFCTVLVISMQLGFALLESGTVPSKNAVSVIFKNYADFALGFLCFFLFGYLILQGDLNLHPFRFLGQQDAYSADPVVAMQNASDLANFIYQAAFATTAATIFSGAIVGRMQLTDYLVLSLMIAAVLYPLVGFMLWNWSYVQDTFQFKDYAGSIVVHATGGAAALAGVLLIGRRPVQERVLPSHNLTLVTMGVFILMVGWFGFNMGSTTQDISTGAGLAEIGRVAINTTIGGSMGMMGALIFSHLNRIPQLSIALNGLLGGLVGITAAPDVTYVWYPFVIGSICGYAVYRYSKMVAERGSVWEHFDDPVGAVVVHLVCGVIGGVGVGFLKFIEGQTQSGFAQIAISILAPCVVFAIFSALIILYHRLVATDSVRPYEPTTTGIYRFLGMCNSLQAPLSEIERGLDLSFHREAAYHIQGELETPRLIVERIDGLLIDFVDARPQYRFTDAVSMADAASYYTFDKAALQKNRERMTIRDAAALPLLSAPLSGWLKKSQEVVERYFDLYGEVVVVDEYLHDVTGYAKQYASTVVKKYGDTTVVQKGGMVEELRQRADAVSKYWEHDIDEQQERFNDAMDMYLGTVWIARTIAAAHDTAARATRAELASLIERVGRIETTLKRGGPIESYLQSR